MRITMALGAGCALLLALATGVQRAEGSGDACGAGGCPWVSKDPNLPRGKLRVSYTGQEELTVQLGRGVKLVPRTAVQPGEEHQIMAGRDSIGWVHTAPDGIRTLGLYDHGGGMVQLSMGGGKAPRIVQTGLRYRLENPPKVAVTGMKVWNVNTPDAAVGIVRRMARGIAPIRLESVGPAGVFGVNDTNEPVNLRRVRALSTTDRALFAEMLTEAAARLPQKYRANAEVCRDCAAGLSEGLEPWRMTEVKLPQGVEFPQVFPLRPN